jgi:hypothetical protein
MRIRALVVLLAVLALPALLEAQTHPCDTAPASVSTKSPFTVGICFDGKDIDGNPTTPTALKVFVDGVLVKTQPSPVPSGPANAAGLSYYTTTGVAAPKGTSRSLTVTIVTADGESDPSVAYTFSVVGAKPSKPVRARVEVP